MDVYSHAEKIAAVDLNDLARDLFDNYYALAEEKGLNLILDPAGEKIVCRCDRNLLKMAIGNLIENAIKYSSQGAIKIKLYAGTTKIGEKGAFEKGAFIEISDDGIGIPKDELHKIFNRGYRAGNVGPILGTGIGLDFAHAVISGYCGQIDAFSEVGRGSTFRVYLPLLHREAS